MSTPTVRQLVREGRMHNYLRMLWGKKILEWSATPRESLEGARQALAESRYADAIEQFKLALKVDNRDTRNWVGLAISLEQVGDQANALKAFSQARTLGGLSQRLSQFVNDRIIALQQVVN